MRPLPLLLLLGLGLWLSGGTASARSYSASDWTIVRRTVVLRISLPAAASTLIDRQARDSRGVLRHAALPTYVLGHVDVHAGDAACPAIDQGEGLGLIDTLAPLPGLSRYEMVFACPAPGELRLDDHILFDRDPGHLDIGRLHLPGHAGATLLLFDAAHQRIVVPSDRAPAGASTNASTNALTNALLGRFIRLGAASVPGSLAPIAIVLLLLPQLRGRADRIACAAALVAGAASALALALWGIAAPRPEAAEATQYLLLLLLAIRAAAFGRRTAAYATVALVVAALVGVELVLHHPGMVRMLLGEALLAPLLLAPLSLAPLSLAPLSLAPLSLAPLSLAGGERTRRLGFLLPAVLLGLVGDAAFGDALRQLGLASSQAWLPVLGHGIGTVSACLLVALLAAAGARLLALTRAPARLTWLPEPARLAWLPELARTGLAGYSVFCLVRTLQA